MPTVAAEADRQLQREWATVSEDRKPLRNRLHGLLATQGVAIAPTKQFVTHLTAQRLWSGAPLPAALVARLERDWSQLQQVEARLALLRRLRRARIQATDDAVAQQTRRLAQLRGIGMHGALTLVTELFAWRGFRNGRQVGASVGPRRRRTAAIKP